MQLGALVPVRYRFKYTALGRLRDFRCVSDHASGIIATAPVQDPAKSAFPDSGSAVVWA